MIHSSFPTDLNSWSSKTVATCQPVAATPGPSIRHLLGHEDGPSLINFEPFPTPRDLRKEAEPAPIVDLTNPEPSPHPQHQAEGTLMEQVLA